MGAFASVVLLLIFAVLPRWAAEFNQELGWPRWRSPITKVIGVALFVGGVGVVLYCSRLFVRLGKGTPVPIDPPKELVVSGLYRFSRNPIHLAQVAVLLSYFCYFGELSLLLYAAHWAVIVHVWVVLIEEPDLRNRFGAAYVDYTKRVPRWVGIRLR